MAPPTRLSPVTAGTFDAQRRYKSPKAEGPQNDEHREVDLDMRILLRHFGSDAHMRATCDSETAQIAMRRPVTSGMLCVPPAEVFAGPAQIRAQDSNLDVLSSELHL